MTRIYDDKRDENAKTQVYDDDDGGDTKVYHDDDTRIYDDKRAVSAPDDLTTEDENAKTQVYDDDDGGNTKVHHDDDTDEDEKTQFSYDDDGGDTRIYNERTTVSHPNDLTTSRQGRGPKLIVRWQTRTLLFIMLGLPVTLILGWLIEDYISPVLFYMLLIGLGGGFLYYQLQLKRWDQD
jgi:hypothetical protein